MLSIKFFGNKDTSGFNLDYLLNELSTRAYTGDRFSNFDDLFDNNLSAELFGGTQNFLLDINGRRVLGDEKFGDGLATFGVMRGLNNAFFNLYTKGSGEFDLDVGSGGRNLVKIKRENHNVIFLSMEHDIANRRFNNDSTDLIQATEEVIKIINKFKQIWLDAILKLQPHRKEEVWEKIFGKQEKMDNGGQMIKMEDVPVDMRNPLGAWLPLEEKWNEIKKVK